MVYVRDWLTGHVDRFVIYWLGRCYERVHRDVERYLKENAER